MPAWIRGAALRLMAAFWIGGALLLALPGGVVGHPAVAGAAPHQVTPLDVPDHGHDHDVDGDAKDAFHTHPVAEHSHVVPGLIAEFGWRCPSMPDGWRAPPVATLTQETVIGRDKPPKPIVGA
jgi:hypothetical protein